MARRLSHHRIILGLTWLALAAELSTAYAQPTPQDASPKPAGTSAASGATTEKPQEKPVADTKDHRDAKRAEDRHDGNKRDGDKHDGEKRDDDNRGPVRGPRGGGRRQGFLQLMNQPGFLMEVMKRDGGPIELLVPLMKPEVREHMSLSPAHAAAVDKFFADMSKHIDEDIQAHQQQPDANWAEIFKKRWETENKEFEKFLKSELPPEQLDRLVGIYIQYRNLRSLSNRIVAEKIGMSDAKALELRNEIKNIREATWDEHVAWARRQIENGNTVQQADQFRKIRAKIDSGIEKLITKKELADLKALRGKELPAELLETLDRPPGPPQK